MRSIFSTAFLRMICGPLGVSFLVGCLSPSATTKVPIDFGQRLDDIQNSVIETHNVVRTSVKTTTNELWPWIVISVVTTILQTALLAMLAYFSFRLVRRWIVENSYLKQKPIYENNPSHKVR